MFSLFALFSAVGLAGRRLNFGRFGRPSLPAFGSTSGIVCVRSRPLLDDRFALLSDDHLRASIQFCVLYQPVPISEPCSALWTAVSFFALKNKT